MIDERMVYADTLPISAKAGTEASNAIGNHVSKILRKNCG